MPRGARGHREPEAQDQQLDGRLVSRQPLPGRRQNGDRAAHAARGRGHRARHARLPAGGAQRRAARDDDDCSSRSCAGCSRRSSTRRSSSTSRPSAPARARVHAHVAVVQGDALEVDGGRRLARPRGRAAAANPAAAVVNLIAPKFGLHARRPTRWRPRPRSSPTRTATSSTTSSASSAAQPRARAAGVALAWARVAPARRRPAAVAGPRRRRARRARQADGDRGGRRALPKLLAELENILTTRHVHFIFVGGPDLHDEAILDATRGNSVYESVFACQLYVPCLWNAADVLLEALIRAERCPPTSAPCCALPRLQGARRARLLLRELNELVRFEGDAAHLHIDDAMATASPSTRGCRRRWTTSSGPRRTRTCSRWRSTATAGGWAPTTSPTGSCAAAATSSRCRRSCRCRRAAPASGCATPPRTRSRSSSTRSSSTASSGCPGPGDRHDHRWRPAGEGLRDRHRGRPRAVGVRAGQRARAPRARPRDALSPDGRPDRGAPGLAVDDHRFARRRAGRALRPARADRSRRDGTVYLAHDARLDRDVAIKLLESPTLRADAQMRARFRREAEIALSLAHPGSSDARDLRGARRAPGDRHAVRQGNAAARADPAEQPRAVAIVSALLDALEYLAERGMARMTSSGRTSSSPTSAR